ncbi:MAG: FxDxF family PEP-CTERM protein [Nitrosomonas sp.]|nr:MAG: FxDxF family PEP-CTERM protein [Nitrosomonas sp.]
MKYGLKLKTTVAAVALMAGSVAHAAPTVLANWGAHDPAEMGFFALITSGATPIDHIFTFSVANTYNGLWSSVTNDAPPVFDISGGLVQLWTSDGDGNYGATDAGDSLVTSLAFDSTAVNQTFTIGPGNYYYQVTGNINGTLGGSYLLSSSITLVPEPETYAMLLAGLGLIGFSLRRRAV